MARNIYKRGRVYYGRIKIAGRDHRRSLRTADRAEALRRLKAWKCDLIAAAHFGLERHSWKEAVTDWAEKCAGGLKPATRKRYLSSFYQVDPILRDLFVDQIDRKVLAKIAGRSGPTNATKRRDLTAVSAVLRACVAWGWLEANPALAFDRSVIRERRDPIRPPSDAEIDAVVRAAPPTFGRLIRLLQHTGMRQEEAAGLTWRQVDAVQGIVRLYATKTDQPRAIRLNGAARGTIEGTPRHLHSPYVFWHGPDGDRYRNVSSRFRELCRRAGVRFRCHDLRHRFAIDWLEAGRDIYGLSRHLGHRSVKTTEVYLGYVDQASAQEGARREGFADG